mmetsp:Transcript_9241/g.10197  ORF Transcript_9241/g.10197 Transcript_9241/m.10197 type:complete len:216 (+) Transcript_9241:104-751(+)
MACSSSHAGNRSWYSLCMAASYKLRDEEMYFNKTTSNKDDRTAVASLLCFENINSKPNVTFLNKSSKKKNIVSTCSRKSKRLGNKQGRYIVEIPAVSKRDVAWNLMFLRLQEFKCENGHCNVPQGYIDDPELATWVKNQRQAYRYMLEKKTTKRISSDRVTRLNHLGFEWRKYVRAEEWKPQIQISNCNQTKLIKKLPPTRDSDDPIITDDIFCK